MYGYIAYRSWMFTNSSILEIVVVIHNIGKRLYTRTYLRIFYTQLHSISRN